jgi:lambda family phage portal protein
MLKAIKKLFSRASSAVTRAAAGDEPSSWTLRRWEAAETTRLNKAHWQKVNGQSINVDLLHDLERLRTRSANEVSNNPTLEGVIHTYATDVAGRNGPTLKIRSDKEAFNKALAAVWKKLFWKNLDIAGRLGGVDWIKLNVRSLFINGEFVSQKVTSKKAVGARLPITMRLKVIHPRRLGTPPMLAGDPDVVLGVRQTADGEPIEYLISDPLRFGPFTLEQARYSAVPAAAVMHRYITLEEDQARGVPWLATPLQSAADMHDYDAQVLDAARAGADNAVFLSTDHPDANYIDVGSETAEVERRQIQTLPPGWKPTMLQQSQPMGNYVEYRSERQRDVGRPVGMPLMMIRLDSSGHNYSSARFDGQIYLRGVQALQGWLERRSLDELVEDVRREAQLYALANPRWEHAAALRESVPYETQWIWPVPPHVDPKKEADAETIGLQNGTRTYEESCAANGTDEDSVIESRAATNKKLIAAGLPPVPTMNGQQQGGQGGNDQAGKIQELRDAATAAEEKGDQDSADTLNDAADALEAAGRASGASTGGGQGAAVAQGPVGLNGAQITAMKDVVGALASGTMAPEAARELLIAGGISEEAAKRIVDATPIVQKDVNAEQKAFEREVVKTFLADKTVADVFYNATDIPHLLTDVGLKLDPDVEKDNSNAIPFLPVIADPGQLVNGDVIKDAAGDIVGGDVEDLPVPAPTDAAGVNQVEKPAGQVDQTKEGGGAEPSGAAAAA